jgi:(S)-3,5-dihydroxyphenylglycine transaminase
MRLQQLKTLQAPCLDVMNFLNEVTLWYPSAISFAPGRPAERFFDVQEAWEQLKRYVSSLTPAEQSSPDQQVLLLNRLGQYQKTNGIINELICRFLEVDEQIYTKPEAIMITDGCQEAMTIAIAGLFEREQDVLMVIDPTYTGITGIASVLGVEMYPVSSNGDGIDIDAVTMGLQQIRAQGKRPRALYIIPDFNNPLGTSMPLTERFRLLELAQEHELLLLEDNAYGMFAYDDTQRLPTLKSLDRNGVVIYLGTFSKLLFPGLRLGFLVADQEVETATGRTSSLTLELSKVKSFTTVSTSALSQAIAGGVLLENGCSLREVIQRKVGFYRSNRNRMLESLENHFHHDPLLAGRVSWNRPRGGFFLTFNLPFPFTGELMRRCAEQYGVICCPMQFFSLLSKYENQVRLAFSYVSGDDIEEGIARWWRFVHDQVAKPTTRATRYPR